LLNKFRTQQDSATDAFGNIKAQYFFEILRLFLPFFPAHSLIFIKNLPICLFARKLQPYNMNCCLLDEFIFSKLNFLHEANFIGIFDDLYAYKCFKRPK